MSAARTQPQAPSCFTTTVAWRASEENASCLCLDHRATELYRVVDFVDERGILALSVQGLHANQDANGDEAYSNGREKAAKPTLCPHRCIIMHKRRFTREDQYAVSSQRLRAAERTAGCSATSDCPERQGIVSRSPAHVMAMLHAHAAPQSRTRGCVESASDQDGCSCAIVLPSVPLTSC